MKVKRADGILFEKMLRNALNYLKQNEKTINDMNVFPVPDGDTGYNMRMTLENGLKSASSNNHLGEYAIELSKGMLMGARGNSGVILSQIFKGFADEVRRDSVIDAKEFAQGFIAGYKKAYNAVIKPVEGTILTVVRESIENIKSQVSRGMYIDTFFSIFLAEAKKSLDYTPNLLPCLKEAGVLDSGGAGFVVIAEGMLKYLHDEIYESTDEEIVDNAITNVNDVDSFNEYSSLDYGYCTEFILQLMASKINVAGFNLNLFIKELEGMGESLVVVKDGTRVKVHIHTNLPARVITYAQMYGEFVSFKLENMALQHSSHILEEEKMEYVDLGKIAIVNGEDIKQTYSELGCHIVIDGGKTMNSSSEEIIKAIKKCNASRIVIFTNNKNIELACMQAIKVLGMNSIHMIKSKNILEGYYALAMDEADNDNIDYRIHQMEEGANAIKTITLFDSTRSCELNGVAINKDDYVCVSDSIVLSCNKDMQACILDSLDKVDDILDRSMCIILKGKNFNWDLDLLADTINEKYPNLEINYLDGGMEVYDAIIGLV